ncbi:abasic site processing protein HMCES [Myxocyprinus asiaticus]|uniref:abasic site processing protein HMCES n=1 Tax=Myxocyprinus asiaticus TaxID=70543 RepID=UPI002222F1F8|nr:abasic site processing protein HMCES [Myxocyprinus asiaticus]XP_051528951.1 abasic site processing protein HMCES [Myxocyprinus asiaticus]XP_051528952.1 abasic site processing protein HMCES [Myxocyprinus asiaticus]
MCGRTACTLAPEELSRACRYRDRRGQRHRPRWKDGDTDKYRPSYNKSPQSFSPVLLSNRHFNKDSPVDECVLTAMRWGLVPAWFKENDPNKMQYSTSNCRSESLLEKKSYKDPLLKGQRCVVLADGFYEWRRLEKEKQPFFIYFPQSQGGKVPSQQSTQEEKSEHSLDQGESDQEDSDWTGWRLLTMAGLFDCWTPPSGGEALYTYTVITVDASPNIQSIHDRMPAVLDGEDEVRRWLDFGEVKSLEAMKLLQPKSSLTFHPVSSLVNNSRNNSPECLQPVDPTIKKTPKPSASSKMMMSWLKTASPTKRKDTDEDSASKGPDGKTESEKQTKPTGPLQQWLLGTGSSKKPKTS